MGQSLSDLVQMSVKSEELKVIKVEAIRDLFWEQISRR